MLMMRAIRALPGLSGSKACAADAHDACHYLSCEVCGLRAQAADAHDACHFGPCKVTSDLNFTEKSVNIMKKHKPFSSLAVVL